MRVKFDLNLFALTGQIREASKVAQIAITEQALADVYSFVPYQTGALANSAMTHSDPEAGKIEHATPYARIRYYKGTPKRPGTTTNWYTAAAKKYGESWGLVAENALKG